MPEIDTDRLIYLVTGVQLMAELGDRPLAYRIEQEMRTRLAQRLGPAPPGQPPRLSPVVISDVYYLNNQEIQDRPAVGIGGPGVNAFSALLVDRLPSVIAIENVLVIQMDLEFDDLRSAVWGMNHLDTVRAVDLFIGRYLDTYLDGVIGRLEE